MNQKNIKIFVVLLLALMVNMSCVLKEENRESIILDGVQISTRSNMVWNFPVNPSTLEWKTLKSYEDQLLAYNIPEGMITRISTEELLEVCLAYPEWGVINAFNSRRVGLNNMMSHFNGFRELFARDDAAKELIKVYSRLDPLAIGENWTLLQKGEYSFQINCIELLLSHGMMIEKLDAQDIQVLQDEAILKYGQKKQLSDVSLWDLSPTAGLYLSILDRTGDLAKGDTELRSLMLNLMAEDIGVLDRAINIKK